MVLLCASLWAQEDAFKSAENERGNNRWEGLKGMTISSRMELLGFHGYRLREYKKGDKLQVRFYAPTDANATVQARKLRQGNERYFMESFPKLWKAGWQAFAPWNVNDFLVPHQILASNLAVLVTNEQEVILPALTELQNKPTERIEYYKVYFSAPAHIQYMSFSAIHKESTKVWYESGTEDEEATKPFYIKVKMPEQAPEGEYELLVEITWVNGRSYTGRWPFYHKNL